MPAVLFYCPDAKYKIVTDVQFCRSMVDQMRGALRAVGMAQTDEEEYHEANRVMHQGRVMVPPTGSG